MLVFLPSELLHEILALALPLHPRPSEILRTSSQIFTLGIHILYTHLRFTSALQVTRFLLASGHSSRPLPCLPRTIEIDVVDGATTDIFYHMHTLFTRCSTIPAAEVDARGRLVLESLRLRLNSHAQDLGVHMVYEALSQINPRRFVWIGPDPPHHFSIAIVPQAIPHLFRALSGHTNLIELKLTHIGFPSGSMPFHVPHIPSLKVFHLGQATFVPPSVIARLILAAPCPYTLETIRLVDVYMESIWGLRLRRSDVEAAAAVHTSVGLPDDVAEHRKEELVTAAIALIHRIVVCEAKTERIIGGDRVENNTLI